MNWKGVMPAITTCFNQDLSVDHGFMAEHCGWLLDNGCAGIVALGSLGEGATLTFDEKRAILRTCVKAVRGRGPLVGSVSALSTACATSRSISPRDCVGPACPPNCTSTRAPCMASTCSPRPQLPEPLRATAPTGWPASSVADACSPRRLPL